MEVELGKLCDTVCSEDFKCHWEQMEHRTRYMFPDGSSQTCVGSQVRCGCTITMSFISHITYEHPTAVMLSFIFISTIVIYLILRCVVTQNTSPIFYLCSRSGNRKPKACLPCTLPTPRDMAISTFNESNNGSTLPTNSLVSGPEEHSIYVIYTDKPPAYSKAVLESKPKDACYLEDTPPPSYSECLGNNCSSGGGGAITNHI